MKKTQDKNTTIAALATPRGIGGIAIVRVSGPRALSLLEALFSPVKAGPYRPYHMRFGRVVHEGETLDEALAVYMKAPHSYTGEDVVEFHLHGGYEVTRRVLSALSALGAEAAEPGAFSRRAFLNGRMDLSQAEAVMALIHAGGQRAAQDALRQMDGGASRFAKDAQARLVQALSHLAAAIDYPDEIEEEPVAAELSAALSALASDLRAACQDDRARVLREGLTVAIVGRPNVGKSSLLNVLLGQDRAIVTDIPGTTRDLVEGVLALDGYRLNIIDTAGIRQNAADAVERLGIARSEKALSGADAVFLVLEAGLPLSEEDSRLLVLSDGTKRLVVLNKSDKTDEAGIRATKALLPPGADIAVISAQEGLGIGHLMDWLKAHVLDFADSPLTLERHMDLSRRAADALDEGVLALKQGDGLDLAAVHFHEALYLLGDITGDEVTEALLDSVFSLFCVGK